MHVFLTLGLALVSAAMQPAQPVSQPARPPEAGAPTALPHVLTFDTALRIFRERGFDVLIAAAAVDSARGDLAASGAFANPVVTGGIGHTWKYDPTDYPQPTDPNVAPAGGPCKGCSNQQYTVGIADQGALLDLLINKRGLRQDVARAALEAAKQNRKDAERQLEFQLRQQFLQALLARAQLDFAREIRATTEQTRALNERRYKLGAISEADVAKTDVAALEAEQSVDLALQALTSAKSTVAFLLGVQGLTPDFEIDPRELENKLPTQLSSSTLESLHALALQTRPDLRALDQQKLRAGSAIRLAHRQRFPDLPLSLVYLQEGSGQNAIQPPTLTLSLQVALPLFYRQQGEILRAEADLRTQTLQRQKLQAQVTADVQTAFAGYAASRRLVERMQTGLLGRAQRARDLVQVQYSRGAASLLDLLDAQRTYIAIHNEYLQDLTSFWTSVSQLEQAVGKDLRQ